MPYHTHSFPQQILRDCICIHLLFHRVCQSAPSVCPCPLLWLEPMVIFTMHHSPPIPVRRSAFTGMQESVQGVQPVVAKSADHLITRSGCLTTQTQFNDSVRADCVCLYLNLNLFYPVASASFGCPGFCSGSAQYTLVCCQFELVRRYLVDPASSHMLV
jgi:hypothetical protein